MNTGKNKDKKPQYIQYTKSELDDFILKPYVKKRRHISYQPIEISRKVLEYNPFPTYGPAGVILSSSIAAELEKAKSKKALSVKERLAELAKKKRLSTVDVSEQAKRISLIDSVSCPGQPTIISHRVAGGITEKSAQKSFAEQLKHVKGAAVSSKKREMLEKRIKYLQKERTKK